MRAALREAEEIRLPGALAPWDGQWHADCNSPSHWGPDGFVLFSSARDPYRASGTGANDLTENVPVVYRQPCDGGRWIEATYQTSEGVLYGWYHNEPWDLYAEINAQRSHPVTAPRIGALRSEDDGRSWDDLGLVLTSPLSTLDRETQNGFFMGGNGDFCVLPDRSGEFLIFTMGTYHRDPAEQGIALARMPLSALDSQVGQVVKWSGSGWVEPGLDGTATPIFPAVGNWHGPNPDVFWGPSVHWNTYLEVYVMVLNRAKDPWWGQNGIWISFNPDLGDPRGWTEPELLADLPYWYPMVLGQPPTGTDKVCGQVGRLFTSFQSVYEIVFER